MYSAPSGPNSISTGRKLMSDEYNNGSISSDVKPEPSSITRCCLMPWNPIVLLTRKFPCASSGKWRLLTISQPAVGRTTVVNTFMPERFSRYGAYPVIAVPK